MHLKPEQLASHLQRKGLSAVYLISGDEPLQLNEAADYIRQQAKQKGIQERIILDVGSDFDWRRLADESANQSLFSSNRLLDLRLGSKKPGLKGGKALHEYTIRPVGGDILLITSNKLEKQMQSSKWYKSLDKVGVTIQTWPIETDKLATWIQQRIQRYNKHLTQEAAQLIADSVEGNMLAASQEIEKLCLLINDDTISIDDITSAVTDNSRFDVFSLIENTYAGQCKRLMRIFHGLKNSDQEPIAIYGVLMWDYRRLCMLAENYANGTPLNKLFAEYRIWGNKRQQAITLILHRHSAERLYSFLQQANAIDQTIKSVEKHSAWDSLLRLLLLLAGYNIIH